MLADLCGGLLLVEGVVTINGVVGGNAIVDKASADFELEVGAAVGVVIGVVVGAKPSDVVCTTLRAVEETGRV